jgi:hypothetical protein
VVIVGPGLDLAPRTGLVDAVPPQSVQPFAIVDSLLSLGLADVSALRVTSLDINPRVVSWLTEARASALSLTLASGVAASETVQPSEDYRQYAGALGRSIGMSTDAGARGDDQARASRRVSVRADVTAMLDARRFDVVTDRIDLGADLGIVTNLLPYFDDPELTLALASISAMLGPGGILIHNEARGAVGAITTALGLPLVQSRTAIIAAVRGSAPLYDSVFVHRRN